ncbi:MAG: hypothetical protein K7J46_14450 [Bryobacter sp.]|jgi:hypothetical protein|nr:hypothetical protein [Bryobacter sp. CoA8 C33]
MDADDLDDFVFDAVDGDVRKGKEEQLFGIRFLAKGAYCGNATKERMKS